MTHRRFCFSLITGCLLIATCIAEDWPQWRGVNRDGWWRESGIVTKFASDRITTKWTAKIGNGYSGPTVSNGRVFVMDRVDEPKTLERIICLDEGTGRELWKVEYPCSFEVSYSDGPRASVTVDGERCYAIGAMGHATCMEVEDGSQVWHRDLGKEYQIKLPIWGIAASPLIFDDRVVLHIGGTGACIVALDKMTGEEKWRALEDDRAQYSAPILIQQAGKNVVVCWTGDSVSGIAPEDGEVYWRYPFPTRNMPIGIATPIQINNKLFVTSFYDGSLMLELSDDVVEADLDWEKCGPSEKDTEALQSIISTPLFRNGHLFGCDSYGELRCLTMAGERLWEDQTATPRARWSNIHFIEREDSVWLFNERGELIIAELTADGFEERSRAFLIAPTLGQLRRRNGVCWAHPAFANGHVFARNDGSLVCADLRESSGN